MLPSFKVMNKKKNNQKKKRNNLFVRIKKRCDDFLSRRPHRSFRLTRRRDYSRSLDLPGYWSFTKYVRNTLWSNRKTFILLALTYVLLTILMVGVGSQDTYSTISDMLKSTGGNIFNGFWGEIGKSGLLLLASGFSTENLSESQQIYAGLILLLAWLTTIWLLRNILAGRKVKLRDGLYSAGSPILATLLVLMLFIVQLIPVALALVGYGAASISGLLDNGVEAMMFWTAAGLLTILSLYLITSTIFALVIITLPGMYPMQAIRAAGDLVTGRRMRILLRLFWMLFGVFAAWVVVMIPIVMFDSWIKAIWSSIEWVPIVPMSILLMSSVTIVWASSYIYLFYRKVVADESAPA